MLFGGDGDISNGTQYLFRAFSHLRRTPSTVFYSKGLCIVHRALCIVHIDAQEVREEALLFAKVGTLPSNASRGNLLYSISCHTAS